MNSNKLVGGLCYLSILFAPIFFPLIDLFISTDKEVSKNASTALGLHIAPFIVTIVGVLAMILFGVISSSDDIFRGVGLVVLILIAIFDVVIFIVNIVKAIKLFLS